MKHIFKLTALFTLIVSIFTFGCGPSKEEQYNTLKQETLKIAEEIDEYDRNLTKEEYKNIEVGKYIKETDKDDKEELAKAIKANKTIAEKLKNKYLAKLEENDKKMKELTKSSVALTKDYEETASRTIHHLQSKINNHISLAKEYERRGWSYGDRGAYYSKKYMKPIKFK